MKAKNLNNSRDLKREIKQLEQSLQNKESAINEGFIQLKTSLQPQNFITTTLRSISKIPDLKSLLIKSAMGIAIGYFAKMSIAFSMKSMTEFLKNVITHHLKEFEEKHSQNFIIKIFNYLRKFVPQF